MTSADIMELERKYKNGNLTSDELLSLRRQLQSESDDDIAERLELGWEDDIMDLSVATPEVMDSISRRIHRKIRAAKVHRIASRTVLAVVAALVPICIGITSYFIHRDDSISEQQIAITTGIGEQSTVTLPDGTVVRLNSQSELTYSPRGLGQTERRIGFRGEALFEVAKDEEHPFIIDADRMKVAVLGTKFNLKSRPDDSQNSLFLLEGLVDLESEITGEHVIVNPGEEAIMDKESMTFTVTGKKDISPILGWLNKELIVKNITASELFALLEKTYGISIEGGIFVEGEDLFTGTLPSDNLPACIEIIEYAYGLRLKFLDGNVQVIGKKSR